MNLSHVIHEFSFGPFFPAIAQPLDMTYAIAEHREHDPMLRTQCCLVTQADISPACLSAQNFRSSNTS